MISISFEHPWHRDIRFASSPIANLGYCVSN